MTENDAPFTPIASSLVRVNDHFRYRFDEVIRPDGRRTTYAYQDQPAGVLVVPATAAGEVILVRQYRYPVRDWCCEVPAGQVDGESPEEAARRELREEVGGTARSLEYLGGFYGSAGFSNLRCHVFLASGVELGERAPEGSEDIELLPVSIDEAIRLARTGGISTAAGALAVLRCEDRLRAIAASANRDRPGERHLPASAPA